MGLIKCDKCNKMISNRVSSCTYCGNPIAGPNSISSESLSGLDLDADKKAKYAKYSLFFLPMAIIGPSVAFASFLLKEEAEGPNRFILWTIVSSVGIIGLLLIKIIKDSKTKKIDYYER